MTLDEIQSLIELFVLESEECPYAFKRVVVVLGAYSFPLLSSLIELVGSDLGHDQVDLHESLLISSEVLVGLQLLMDPLAELVPVQISNQIFELLLVDLVSFLERIHVDFDEVLVSQCLGQHEFGFLRVLYLVQILAKAVESVNFLNFES